MLDELDYSYNDVDSLVHRLNSSFKFIGLFIYVLICLLKFNNILFIVNTLLVFILILLSNIKYIRYLKVIWNLKYIIIIYYFVTLNALGMDLSSINILLFKILFFIMYIKVIIFTTPKENIGRGLGRIFNVFNFLGISIKIIELFFINLFDYRYLLVANNNQYINSLEHRGIDYSHNNIIEKTKISLLGVKSINDKSIKDIKNKKEIIKDRLYNDKVKRLYKYRNRFNIFDIIYMIINIAMIIYYVLVVR